ncbi:MAG: S8 family serine peptidase [Planctomycetes bacterium]|nr:S8 family serine peptidase [Planctomycetota bacterium]
MSCTAPTPRRVLVRTAACLAGLLAAASAAQAADTGDAVKTRVIAVPDSSIVLKLWQAPDDQGRRTPHYAISFDGGADFSAARATSYDLKLRAGRFDPLTADAPFLSQSLEAADDVNVYIVQFVTQPLEEYRAAVRDLGGTVHPFYLADHSHLVKMTPEARAAVAQLPFVRWVGKYEPGYRLESFMRDNVGQAEVLYPSLVYNIMLFESSLETKEAVAQRIADLGGVVHRAHAGKYIMEATLTADQLFQVARFDEVLFIDRWGPMETDMEKSRILSGANYVETVAGFTGTGVRGEVYDTGFNLGHVDFASRPLIEHGSTGGSSHGSSTSGIVFGDGTGNPDATGILKSGQGIVSDTGTMPLTGPTRYDMTEELLDSPYFAMFQTASVGSPRVTEYTTISADHDAMLFDHRILHCQSQSNAGTTNSRPQAWAKNIISGGGVNHYDTLTKDDDCWCGGGSTGPATDGRIKPDLCHFYDDTFTVTSGGPTSYTTSFGGTSGATPNICGYTGLFMEMWANEVFQNTVPVPGGSVYENRPQMTTAKAAMINTASQYPFSGPGDLHRYKQGWGMPDVQRLYDMREKMLIINEDDVLPNLASISYNVSVPALEPAFKATMTYADPAGTPSSTQHRVNNLDLRVVSPGGTVYWGNVGLVDNMWSTSGGSPNTVDTVENVFVENPEQGSWTIEVIAAEVVADNHLETPQIDVDFALVVSGGTLGPGFGIDAEDDYDEVCAPDTASYDIELTQLEGFMEPVVFSAIDAPAGTTVSFTQNNVVPPGATTMIISDTDLAAPGTYTIEIVGTTPEQVKSTFVNLNISTSVPGAVALQTPANGATDVGRLPMLTWDAVAQGVTYDLEVSTSPAFSSIDYAATVTGTMHAVGTNLELGTEYFWRVKSANICGVGPDSGTFGFTVIDQLDYFTEEIDGGDMDLENLTLSFVPDGTADFYDACLTPITELPIDPAGGVVVVPGDDSSTLITIFGPPVVLYGTPYPNFYLNSNGHITFGAPDSDPTVTLTNHFSIPRISALYNNLDPGTQGIGDVSYKPLADRIVVTFEGATESGLVNSSPFQIEMHYTGEIRISYLEVEVTQVAIVGLSDGTGLPVDFLGTDASATPECAGLCVADLDGSGDVGFGDILTIIGAWGPCGVPCPEDLSGNGQVDFADILEVIAAFGDCP